MTIKNQVKNINGGGLSGDPPRVPHLVGRVTSLKSKCDEKKVYGCEQMGRVV